MDPAPVGGAPLHQISPPIPQGNGLPQAGNGPQPGDGVPAPVVVGPNEAQILVSQGFGNRCVGQPATAASFYFVLQAPGTNFCGPTAMRHYTGTSFPSISEFNATKFAMAAPMLQATVGQITDTLFNLTDERVADIVAINHSQGGSANSDEIDIKRALLMTFVSTNDPTLISKSAEELAEALSEGLPWNVPPKLIPQETLNLNGAAETIRFDAGTVEAGGADPGVVLAMLQRLDPNTRHLSSVTIGLGTHGRVDYQGIFTALATRAPNADRAIICVPNHFFTVRKAGNEWHLLEAYSYIGRPAAIHEPEGGTNPYENWPHTEETFMGVIFSAANNVGQTLNTALTPLGK